MGNSARAALIRNPAMDTRDTVVPPDETAVLQVGLTLPCTAAALTDAITAVVGQTGDPSEVSVEGVMGYDANHLKDTLTGVTITRNITPLVGGAEGLTPVDL